MSLLQPPPPPYDALEWRKRPYAERVRTVCESWALEGFGSPPAVLAFYAVKIALYVAGWVFSCSLHPDIAGLSDLPQWWLTPVAFQKAIVFSMLFEVLGLGCGSGPLSGRYFPPFGGALYFTRPGTTKLPLFPHVPILGGRTRSLVDVALYFALLASLAAALVAPEPGLHHFLPIVVILPILGIADRTIFLAARSEHYLMTTFCFLFADWIAGAKVVQLALWFWAGVSKLNHHFPGVTCVMQSNAPLCGPNFRRRLYRNFPFDLGPSGLAVRMARVGILLELTVPICLALGSGGPLSLLGFVLMIFLHSYILTSVPAGVPLEWNLMVVYGAFFLFGENAEVPVLAIDSFLLGVPLFVACGLLPLLGNLFPHRVSFLLAMRYYAGNWPFGMWLFREKSHQKLDRLTKTAPWVLDQLTLFYDKRTAIGLLGKVLAFRAMHLHGRILSLLVPRAVERCEDYELVDGEVVGGLVLGYNFGDGHLHGVALLESIQAQCAFEPGELRCIFVEPQPIHRPWLRYQIHDAASGRLEAEKIPISELLRLQPWPTEDR